jgi:branched-chain amino acid transport system ATP-binding protein
LAPEPKANGVTFALSGVSARYGSLTALSDISLTFAEREKAAIFGHNGAGKTTLLNCIVGAHTDMSGPVVYRGEAIVPGAVHQNVRRGIGYVPQGHNVFPNLTVDQNLKISGLMYDVKSAKQIYELFPVLEERSDQRAGSMSGGEQQMLALGMALMSQPGVLLLDEPTTGLAPVIVKNVLSALRHVNEAFDTALIVVEQNVPATLEVVDRAVVLQGGRVVFDGSSAELKEKKDLWEWF